MALVSDGGPQSGPEGRPARSRRRHGQRGLEGTEEAAFAALDAVSAHTNSQEDLPAFFSSLGASIAQLGRARRAAFWRLGPRGWLTVQPVPFGFPHDSPIYDIRLELDGDGAGLRRLVLEDEIAIRNETASALDAVWRASGLTNVRNSIAAPWRVGERRLGMIAVYDSLPGFTERDVWLLRLAGVAAGLVWQYRESEEERGQTAGRLGGALAGRRHLLNNIAAGGDEARRRFATALHDDSLQLLTAAELQLERVRAEANGEPPGLLLDEVHNTLRRVEDSLRRLLTNVSPEPLETTGDLREGISERLESMRIRAGIEGHIDARLPEDVPRTTRAVVLNNVGEALNNVEKHARATHVTVVADSIDGGIRVAVTDDGTGFVAVESLRMPGHIGLVAMRERAQLAGGWCRIESEPGTGTKVEFWVPLNQ